MEEEIIIQEINGEQVAVKIIPIANSELINKRAEALQEITKQQEIVASVETALATLGVEY